MHSLAVSLKSDDTPICAHLIQIDLNKSINFLIKLIDKKRKKTRKTKQSSLLNLP